MKTIIRSFFSAAPKGDATFLSRVTKGLTAAALALAAMFVTGSAWADTDELGLTPKHWYKFNGNMNSSGEAAVSIDGENGGAYFAGVNDQAMKVVDSNTHPYGSGVQYGDGAWSIVTVAKAVFDGSNLTVFWTTGKNGSWFGLLANPDGTAVVAKGNGSGVQETSLSASVNDIASYHVYAIVYDGNSTLSLYVDGALAATNSNFEKRTSADYQWGAVNGGMPTGLKRPTGSGLDDWRLYQKALTAGEVRNITCTFVHLQDEIGVIPTYWMQFEGALINAGSKKMNVDGENGKSYTVGRPGSQAYLTIDGSAHPYGSFASNHESAFTVMTWLRTPGTANAILWAVGNKDACVGMKETADGVTLFENTGSGSTTPLVAASLSTAASKFHQYAIAVDGNSVTFYIDGEAVGSATKTVSLSNGYQLGGVYQGIADISDLTRVSNVAIDDFRLYEQLISADNIKAIYIAGMPDELSASIDSNKAWSGLGFVKTPTAETDVELTVSGNPTLTFADDDEFGSLRLMGSGSLTLIGSADFLVSHIPLISVSSGLSVNVVFDATVNGLIADDRLLSAIKGAGDAMTFTFLGDGENGATLDFAAMGNGPKLATHLVFEGGVHTLKYKRADSGFSTTSTAENPVVLVKGSTELTFNANDLTYWSGDYLAGGIIRVNDGGILNIADIGGGSFYYRQQFYLDPGATINVRSWTTGSPAYQGFRLQGGTGNDVIYVPESPVGNTKVVTINGNIHIHHDTTIGFGVNVGENSILSIGSMTAEDPNNANYKIVKRGAGKLVAAGDFNINTIEVADGSLAAGGTIKSVILTKATAIEVAEGKTATISAISGDYSITKTGAGTLNLPNAYAGAIALAEGRVDPTFVGTLTIAGDLAFAANELPLISTFATSGHTGSITLPNGFFGQIAKISGDDKPSDLVIKDSTGTPITEGFAKDTDGYLVLKADEITTVADVSRPTEFIGAMRFGEGGGVTVKHATPNTPMYYTSDAITVAEDKKAVVTLDLYGQYEVGTEFVMLKGASIPEVKNFTCKLGATPTGTTITPSVKNVEGGQALVFTIASSLLSSQSDVTKAALAKAVANFDAGRFETLTLDDAGNVSKWTNLGYEAGFYDATPAGNGREANQKPAFAIVDGRPVVDFGECNSQKDLGFERVAIKAAIQVIQLKNDKRAFYLGDYNGGEGKYSFHRDQSDVNPPLFNTGNAKTFAVYDNGVDRGRGISGTFPETMRVISVATDSDECYTDCFTMDRNNVNNRSGGRKLCETLLFTEELTTEEREAIEAYLVEKWALFAKISYDGDVSVSTINADVAESDSVQIILVDGATLSVDQEIAKPLSFICDGHFTVVGDGYAMTNEDLAKLNLLSGTATCVFDSDMEALPMVAPAAGVAYRFEKDYSEGIAFNLGGGIYEFAKAKITNFLSNQYTIRVQPGDEVWLDRTNGSNYSCSCANVEVLGGSLKVGREENGATWIGNGTTYTISGGTVTSPVNGTGLSGNGNGFLLGFSGTGVTSLTMTGGELLVPDSSINFWIKCVVSLSGTGKIRAKGVINNNTASTVTISDNAVFELGSLGWVSSVPLTLNGGTLKAVESSTFSAPITINAASPIEVDDGITLTLSGEISGDVALSKTGTGTLALSLAARPKLGAITAGKVRFVATADEVLASKIVIPTTEASYASGAIEVVDGTGAMVDVEKMTVSEGVLTIELPRNVIEETSSVSQWKSMKGEVVIKAEDEETELTITVDQAFSPDITAITVFGKVRFIYADGIVASSMPINPQTGAEVTIENALKNPVNMVSGSKIFINDATVEGQINMVSGSEAFVDGEVTLNSDLRMAGGATLTVNPSANLIFGTDRPFTAGKGDGGDARSSGTFNIYGTVELGTYSWVYESNSGACAFNFYAGSVIRGTTGNFKRGGGGGTSYNLKAFEGAGNNCVTFDVARGNTYADNNITFNIEDGVGVKLLKNSPSKSILSGTNIAGVEMGASVGTAQVTTAGSLGGKVIVGAGSTLELGAENVIVTDGDTPAELAIAGTLNCNNHSQDLAELNITNNMTIANGVFPNATVTVKEGVTLTTTGNALTAANIVMNGAVNGAVRVTGTLSGAGSVTSVTLADGAYLDATAGALTIPNLLTEGEKIVIKCKASGGALVKGLEADPSSNVKLIDQAGVEIPLRKGRFAFKDGTLSFKFNAFMLMLK